MLLHSKEVILCVINVLILMLKARPTLLKENLLNEIIVSFVLVMVANVNLLFEML